jgi:hypothetical protein
MSQPQGLCHSLGNGFQPGRHEHSAAPLFEWFSALAAHWVTWKLRSCHGGGVDWLTVQRGTFPASAWLSITCFPWGTRVWAMERVLAWTLQASIQAP